MPIAQFLDSHGITQAEFGTAIGLKPPTLNKKLKGTRSWKLAEVSKAIDVLRKRVADEALTFEDLFGAPKRARRARKVAA
jgi:hypothetical protein